MRITNGGLVRSRLTRASLALLAALAVAPSFAQKQAPQSVLPPTLEQARRARDEGQLRTLEAELTQGVAQNPRDATGLYQLALVENWLVDVSESRKDKKAASAAVDKAIEAARKSIAVKDDSADAHSLLADLYGRKISYGGMFAGFRLGPKVSEENKRALALDDKNPRVWASLGRQYFFTPRMFGGNTGKAVESFRKSLDLDPQQDETWIWLARALQKQGDKQKARDAIQRALQLNPQSQFAKRTAASLEK